MFEIMVHATLDTKCRPMLVNVGITLNVDKQSYS